MLKLRRLLAAAAFSFAAFPVSAATLYSSGPTGVLQTDQSISATFSSGLGAGQVDFQVQGYASLDGDNFYIDIRSVLLNGTPLFSATWNLGGGGIDRVLSNPFGATVTRSGAQTVDISLPITLAGGTSTLVFDYSSPFSFEGVVRAGFQGLGDEGWGLNSVSVTGPVPEPGASWLILAGLGVLGMLAVRRRAG